jgi:hypothetical protein
LGGTRVVDPTDDHVVDLAELAQMLCEYLDAMSKGDDLAAFRIVEKLMGLVVYRGEARFRFTHEVIERIYNTYLHEQIKDEHITPWGFLSVEQPEVVVT